ncbi:hypothetical protein [Moraxella lacunata]|uniref:hypothetical protein n=1 Tax=Moraxella lacunata TaxID=477 RepID=UPI003EDF0654
MYNDRIILLSFNNSVKFIKAKICQITPLTALFPIPVYAVCVSRTAFVRWLLKLI